MIKKLLTLVTIFSVAFINAQEISNKDINDIKLFLSKFQETAKSGDAFALKKMILVVPNSPHLTNERRNKVIEDVLFEKKNYSEEAIELVKNKLLFYFELPNEEQFKNFDIMKNPEESNLSDVKRSDFFMFEYKKNNDRLTSSIVLLKLNNELKLAHWRNLNLLVK